MLRRTALLLVLGPLLAGCPSTPDVVRLYTERDTPVMSFQTFRSALQVSAADVIYEGLSPGFKERYGVPGLGQFTLGYKMYKSDFDELAAILGPAKVTNERFEMIGGRRYAFVTVASEQAEGDFVLVDLPTWEVTVRYEGYDEATRAVFYLSGSDFSEVMTVRDDKLYVGPFDTGELGITEVGEVVRLSVQHQWLLEDIVRLANVKPLIDRVRQAKSEP
jgi:hypothetical protein